MTRSEWRKVQDGTRTHLSEVQAKIREIPLKARLKRATWMINRMCTERRPPKITIPARCDDEDIFISTTLKDAMEALP